VPHDQKPGLRQQSSRLRDQSRKLFVVREDTPAPTTPRSDEELSVARGRFPPLGRSGRVALAVALLTGAITHGYHLFSYPLYLTDEGIYMQRAWSLVRETRLSPYTYDYDHAPGGWITLAGWAYPMPNQFETFGNAINTGRFLMLLVHLASVFLLFEITRRLSGSVLAASVATFFYNVSPLAVYYQRQVLLDSLMMFWVLLSLFALLRSRSRVRDALGGGLALGIALITKENAIFFFPTFVYLLHRRIKDSSNHRFSKTLWPFAAAAPVGAYVMYALLKNELFPSRLDFDLNNPPADHVSLLYTAWWQLNRNQGMLLSRNGLLYTSWLPRDGFLLLAGVVAVAFSLYWGLRDRERELGFLVAGTLAFAYGFYLVRGSVVLDFYVAPLIPLLAMNIGMVTNRVLKRGGPTLKRARFRLRIAVPGLVGAVLLLTPATGYFLTFNDQGQVAIADQYQPRLRLTDIQEKQVEWVRKHVPSDARIIMDDDLWSELHDVRPFYPYAHSHWNAVSDPDVRDKLFAKKWQNIDYIIMSNKMRQSIVGNNADGREDWVLEALKNSEKVWEAGQGDIKLEIYRVR
jgi:4-amino-4-deoxy-L-arabinose transferase-like glycosyltransferase